MSQYDPGDLESPVSGTAFVNTHFEPTIDAINTCHSGASRPTYAQAGMIWLDNTTTPWILKIFDGTDDITIGTVNSTTNLFVPSNSQKWGGTSAGTANAKTLTPTPALATLAAGVAFEFIVDTPNTTAAPTINISGTGAKTVKVYFGAAKVNLPIGGLQGICRIIYDGTDYILINARPYLKSSNIATASTVDLGNANGDYVTLTGTTTVSAFTLAEGQQKTIVAGGAFTITDGTADSPQGIILPGGADITTVAGDAFIIRGEAGGTTRVILYTRGDGSALAGGSNDIMIVQHALGAGSSGGTFTASSWQTKVLNTVDQNSITGASLASNQITLPAGDFEVETLMVGYNVLKFASRFRNVTDGATVINGSLSFSNGSAPTNNTSHGIGKFTIAASKDFELQGYCQSSQSSNGYGNGAGFSGHSENEIFAYVVIKKVG